jgi:hypothetical protein
MSAYLLPYFVNDQNQTKVLCAQKQVLSYEAIGKLEIPALLRSQKTGIDWQTKSLQMVTSYRRMVESEGSIGRRLEGMLLPAGGKMAFFGGRTKRGWEEFLS